MAISKLRIILLAVSVFAVLGLSQIVLESHADARAGGGSSGGFRGSRSYQSPTRPAQPSQPRREATPPPQQPAPLAPQPGGFMRGLGTAILGGFLGSMLFSGIANAGGLGGLGGSGFGAMQYQNSQPYTQYTPASVPVQETPVANDPVDYRSLTMMDRSFDPDRFLKTAQDLFFKVQGAWNKQDTAALSSLCGSELMQTWQEELANLRNRGQKNLMENIALRESEITEAWTEGGADFITVRLHANLLDYIADAKTGAVISGNNSDPIEFEEYWTFTRPVGPNAWKLSAVQQA